MRGRPPCPLCRAEFSAELQVADSSIELSEPDCCVCLEEMTSPVKLECGHVVCLPCITEIRRRHQSARGMTAVPLTAAWQAATSMDLMSLLEVFPTQGSAADQEAYMYIARVIGDLAAIAAAIETLGLSLSSHEVDLTGLPDLLTVFETLMTHIVARRRSERRRNIGMTIFPAVWCPILLIVVVVHVHWFDLGRFFNRDRAQHAAAPAPPEAEIAEPQSVVQLLYIMYYLIVYYVHVCLRLGLRLRHAADSMPHYILPKLTLQPTAFAMLTERPPDINQTQRKTRG